MHVYIYIMVHIYIYIYICTYVYVESNKCLHTNIYAHDTALEVSEGGDGLHFDVLRSSRTKIYVYIYILYIYI